MRLNQTQWFPLDAVCSVQMVSDAGVRLSYSGEEQGAASRSKVSLRSLGDEKGQPGGTQEGPLRRTASWWKDMV